MCDKRAMSVSDIDRYMHNNIHTGVLGGGGSEST